MHCVDLTHIFTVYQTLPSTKTSLDKCSNMFICQHIISINVKKGIRFLLCLIYITIKPTDTLSTSDCHVIKDGDKVGSVAHVVRGYDVCTLHLLVRSLSTQRFSAATVTGPAPMPVSLARMYLQQTRMPMWQYLLNVLSSILDL